MNIKGQTITLLSSPSTKELTRTRGGWMGVSAVLVLVLLIETRLFFLLWSISSFFLLGVGGGDDSFSCMAWRT